MRAVCCVRGEGGRPALVDCDAIAPATPRGRDLLVRVRGVGANPLDIKVMGRAQAEPILGWDASGLVEAVGPDAVLFKPGDEVFYAGAINRPGCYAELQLVDERIVGRKPRSLTHLDAAALPLTSLAAYEALFERLQAPRGPEGAGASVLIYGGVGGVASAAVQLARRLTSLTVIAVSGRPASTVWLRDLGAHQVLDRKQPLAPQFDEAGTPPPTFILSTHTSEESWREFAALIAPQGGIALLDQPSLLDFSLVKAKSVSIHWEAMFARSTYDTSDIERQHEILGEVADLVDAGVLRATTSHRLGALSAEGLTHAHTLLRSRSTLGKIVFEGLG